MSDSVTAPVVAKAGAPTPAQKAPAPRPSGANLSDIAGEVVSCRACDLHQQRIYPVAGRGPEKGLQGAENGPF